MRISSSLVEIAEITGNDHLVEEARKLDEEADKFRKELADVKEAVGKIDKMTKRDKDRLCAALRDKWGNLTEKGIDFMKRCGMQDVHENDGIQGIIIPN